jgi:co-chaperonin GroES (HSP10)
MSKEKITYDPIVETYDYEEIPEPGYNAVVVKVNLPHHTDAKGNTIHKNANGDYVTAGGIALPSESVERESLAETTGYIYDLGPLAFKVHKGVNGETPTSYQIGDKVLFKRYAGKLLKEWSDIKVGVVEHRMMSDSEIIGRFPRQYNK